MAAVPDNEGLVFSDNFIGLWPRAEIPIEVLAALLNGPVANAFVSDTQQIAFNRRRLTLKHLATLPVPWLSPDAMERIATWVHRVQLAIHRDPTVDRSLWLSLDAEVLRAYDLPPFMETRLLQSFDQSNRPGVPFHWSYYDTPISCAMPLFSWTNGQMERAEAKATMDRITIIDNPQVREWAEQWMEHGE